LDPCDKESHFGLVHGNFAPKPAYAAYMTFIGARPAGSVQKSVRWKSKDCKDYYPQWTRPDGTAAGMVWTAGAERRVRLTFSSRKISFFDVSGVCVRPHREGSVYHLNISGSPIYFAGGELKAID
jgi:hypothetical protein